MQQENSPPAIDAIIATKDRRELLLKAVEGIQDQDYPGPIRLTIVFDGVPADHSLERTDQHRPVRVASNSRTAGLAGGRNTGLFLADHPLVAFCDDDDIWRSSKITTQVRALREHDAVGCVTGIMVHTQDRQIARIPRVSRISAQGLYRSRLTGAHPSSFVFDRRWLLEKVGPVDEALPFGYGEDFDLLLRAALEGTVTIVPEPLVDVLWHSGSFFTQRWAGMAAGLEYVLKKHPGLAQDRKGLAWMEGQRAFALAAKGDARREALVAAGNSLRARALEPRGWLAIAVALNVLKADWVMRTLNARGHGI